MRLPTFYAAVFAIIRDDAEKILFQKRQNTGFRDGQFQLPSGHVEGSETIVDSIIRELKEEIDIVVTPSDVEVVHIAHTVAVGRVYFNIYVNIRAYSWEIANLEPEKCSEVAFYDFGAIKHRPEFHYETETLEKIFAWEIFSEKCISG